MNFRQVIFHPKARENVREFPEDVRSQLGKALFTLQAGEPVRMPVSRPMPSIYPGTAELRIRGQDGAYRVFYYLKCEAGILIIHAFKKKSQQTPMLDIEVARKRLKEMLHAKAN